MERNTFKRTQISVWVTEEEKKEIERQSHWLGLSVSSYLKMLSLKKRDGKESKNG